MAKNYMDESLIIAVIEHCLNLGYNTFVIYPYGKHGKSVKWILNTYFEIEELAIADNRLCVNREDILSLDELKKLDQEYILLLASDNQEISREIRDNLYSKVDSSKVIDIANQKILDGFHIFNLIGEKLQIEECNQDQIQNIFEKTQAVWKHFGEEEPYWSVVTHDEFKSGNMDLKALKRFYMQGLAQAVRIVQTVIRNEIVRGVCREQVRNLDVLEIGCGCGRVTKHLAKYFRKVVAMDISGGNIDIARQNVHKSNVEFRLLTELKDYDRMPQSDVVYSYLVLQHNCPPVIEYMIKSMMQCVKKRGILIFQVPTYRRGYEFEYKSYMEEKRDAGVMEMHVLLQRRIFEIAYEYDCIPLEVYPDDSTGQADNSTWFVFKKIEKESQK